MENNTSKHKLMYNRIKKVEPSSGVRKVAHNGLRLRAVA